MQAELIVPILDRVHHGMYVRSATISKGTVMSGLKHNEAGLGFLMSGIMEIREAGNAFTVTAPEVLFTEAGAQKLAYAVTDCVYVTIHKVTSSTTEDAELELFDGTPQITRIRNDFKSLGVTTELPKKIAANAKSTELKQSTIHGTGLFATKEIAANEVVDYIKIDGIDCIGAFTNHSDKPNSYVLQEDNIVAIVALFNISKGQEVTIDYKDNKWQQ